MSLVTGLISYYQFTSNANDSYGPNPGTGYFADYNNSWIGPTYTANPFPGPNGSYIDLGAGASLNLTGAMSFSGWVLVNSMPTGGVLLFTRALGNGSVSKTYELKISDTRQLQFGAVTSGASLVATGQPHRHVVLTRTAGNLVTLYLDGVQVGVGTGHAIASLPAKATLLGARDDHATDWPAGFRVDEVGIWDRALSSGEVTTLYGGGSGITFATVTTPDPIPPYGPLAPAYARQLLDLLPPGKIWDRESDSRLRQILLALGVELDRVAGRGVQLINESDPRTSTETIDDWERMLSLPDERVPVLSAVLEERRLAVVQKFVSKGGQSVGFFVALALACGYVVTIGKTNVLRVGFRVSDRVYGDGWAYSMTVTASPPAGASLTHAQFEAVIRAAAHSHITVIFSYLP